MSSSARLRVSALCALAVTGAVLAGSVSVPAVAAPQSMYADDRVCGRLYRSAPDPAAPDLVTQVIAYVIRVDKDSHSVCDQANARFKSDIQKQDPQAKFDDQARKGPVNSWNKFEMMDCKDIGIYIATYDGPYTDPEFCRYMTRSPRSWAFDNGHEGDWYTYKWVKDLTPPAVLNYPVTQKLRGKNYQIEDMWDR